MLKLGNDVVVSVPVATPPLVLVNTVVTVVENVLVPLVVSTIAVLVTAVTDEVELVEVELVEVEGMGTVKDPERLALRAGIEGFADARVRQQRARKMRHIGD